ncbi:MAG: response regulator [Lachnospiraceae bacterium]
MIKIMICDDEGIVRDSLKFIIDRNLGADYLVETAKSGRGAIELADSFRPDIVIMDIQMPGINGIEAIKEIKKEHHNIEVIILTAYDKFSYAKEAIDIGVLDYLTKPMNKDKVVEVLNRATQEVEKRKAKTSYDLEVKEKLETVIPIIENGFIYSILLSDEGGTDNLGYDSLLDICGEHGYIIVVEYGDESKNGQLTNPVGASVKMQRYYMDLREIMKEYFNGIVGPLMANKVIVCVTLESKELEYNERVQVIERARAMVRKLDEHMGLKFKVGIGSMKELSSIHDSYKEALTAMKQSIGKVTHIKDIPVGCKYEEKYPIQIETAMFEGIQKGQQELVRTQSEAFIDWMQEYTPKLNGNVKLKVMEFVLRAEYLAYQHGGMTYYFNDRQEYLDDLVECQNYDALRKWFLTKMLGACYNMVGKQKEKSTGVIAQAKAYIDKNYEKELSLDDVSREVNISPYYFSKLFKEETGINYIDYLTKIRIDQAKKLLQHDEYSIKQTCIEVGYSDPNYFSRTFKRCVGVTPSEYREGGTKREEI